MTNLTPQEHRALVLLANGLTVVEAAERLEVMPQTVKTHLTAAYKKLRVRNRAEAFMALGWLTPPELDDA